MTNCEQKSKKFENLNAQIQNDGTFYREKLKHKEASEKQIKVKCLDDNGNKVTEYLPCIKQGDPFEFFLDFVDEMNVLKERYSFHANFTITFITQSYSQALSGQFADKWREFSGGLHLSENDQNVNK